MSRPAPQPEGSEPRGEPTRVAVVTGAARGIGRAIVDDLALAGLHVVATDRDLVGIEGIVHERVVAAQAMDVTDAAEVERCATSVVARFGRIDVLVNNAGVFHQTPALAIDEANLREILDVNLAGALRCTAAFGRVMARNGGGRIINIASVSAITGAALACVYAASKAGLIAATRSAARELAPHGITVNAVAPGYTDTAMLTPYKALVERFAAGRIPLARFATPTDVAEVVTFLATAPGGYLTGSVITLDGGMSSG
ncbi:MAG: SDR family oxidoreductase [Myxococcota bacterium]